MRGFPIGWFIVVVAAIMLILGWRIYGAGEMGRFAPAIHAQRAPSELHARLLVRYTKPPVYEEEYVTSDVEGISDFRYRIRGWNGHEITVSAPPARVYDVSFFFGKLGQDGIWDLDDKPARPGDVAHYSVYVKQLADYQHGERTVLFTDPKYWATKQGRQYSIDLSKGVPKDLVHMESTQASDPRYLEVVNDFRDFGPDEFKRNVAKAQARIRGSHG